MGDIQGYTALCQSVPYTEVPALRWSRDPCTGSTNALLESLRVKDNIILEMAKQKKVKKTALVQHAIFNSVQMIGKRGIHRN